MPVMRNAMATMRRDPLTSCTQLQCLRKAVERLSRTLARQVDLDLAPVLRLHLRSIALASSFATSLETLQRQVHALQVVSNAYLFSWCHRQLEKVVRFLQQEFKYASDDILDIYKLLPWRFRARLWRRVEQHLVIPWRINILPSEITLSICKYVNSETGFIAGRVLHSVGIAVFLVVAVEAARAAIPRFSRRSAADAALRYPTPVISIIEKGRQVDTTLLRYIVPAFSSYYPDYYVDAINRLPGGVPTLHKEKHVKLDARRVELDLRKDARGRQEGAMTLLPGVIWGQEWEGVRWL